MSMSLRNYVSGLRFSGKGGEEKRKAPARPGLMARFGGGGGGGGDGSGRTNECGKLLSTQGNAVLAFVVSLLLLAYYIFAPDRPRKVTHDLDRSSVPKPGSFHMLIPASHGDVNLCKTMLSGALLNYPTPTLINWGKDFQVDGLVEGGSHLAKIAGVHEYLHSLKPSQDEDLVLMVDGYDIWMQLRPQTLVDRYFEINRRADERIRSEVGAAAAKKHNIRQEIIFGCQKRCWPWTWDDPPCYAVPNSTLPSDIFGPQTDTPSENEENPYINNRPRFLVSGTAIGTVRALRKLFDQAEQLSQYEYNFGSDQYIFSHIFGDQEIWREIVARDSKHVFQPNNPHHAHFNEKHMEEVRAKAQATGGDYEFGIGIDYGSEIVLNTVFAEDDTEWLTPNDKTAVSTAQTEHQVPAQHRKYGLSSFIQNTLPPFWTFSKESSLLRWADWADVRLFTNVFTGVHPAIIHHNAHRNGLKSLRESWWGLTWFQSNARTLLDAYIYAPVTPLAHHARRAYWSYEIWRGGARDGAARLERPEGWIRFDELCQEEHEELFRDGKGEWRLPEAH